MINNPIVFYTASTLLVLFTFLTLFVKNALYSIIFSIFVFFCGAIFFYILGSEYNAIIQAAIYGLAVPVILGISIMFIKKEKKENTKGFAIPYITSICALIFIMAICYIVMISLNLNPNTFDIKEVVQTNSYETILAFAKGIFINYVWAFELVSLLLLIVVAGLTMFKKES